MTITGRDEAKLAVAKKALGGTVAAIAADATDPLAMREAFSRIGPFDHLILALGSGKGVGPFASVDLGEVRNGGRGLSFAPPPPPGHELYRP